MMRVRVCMCVWIYNIRTDDQLIETSTRIAQSYRNTAKRVNEERTSVRDRLHTLASSFILHSAYGIVLCPRK